MDFIFTTTPERVAASMCRPMAWAALDRGHGVHAVRTWRESGIWRTQMETPEAMPPADPFAYGHTGLVEAIAEGAMPGWRLDWIRENFDRELWIQKLGRQMWNHKARVMPLGEALSEWTSGRMHLCPAGADSGPKAFKGICVDFAERGFELGRASKGRALDRDMRVALSEPDQPWSEYRCVFAGGVYAAAGRYMDAKALSEEPEAPERVVCFAKEIASQWLPGRHCVVDVGVGEDGRLGVVEFNSLHSSGLYSIKRDLVIQAVAEAWPRDPKPVDEAARREERPRSCLRP